VSTKAQRSRRIRAASRRNLGVSFQVEQRMTEAASRTRSRGWNIVAGMAFAYACIAPAHAQVKGDLWEVTVKMQMTGVPMDMPPNTTRTCMDKNAKDEAFVPQKSEDGECHMADTKRTGNVWRYRMVCTSKDRDTTTVDGEVTYASDSSYTGRMKMVAKSGEQSFEMNQTFSGRKVGECTK
jgi:hypothetical protein